jgi:hypothetical protein
MNDLEKMLFRDLHSNPVFTAFCREMETHKPPLRWKSGYDTHAWAHDSGFGDGIDFVLKRMGYDNGR